MNIKVKQPGDNLTSVALLIDEITLRTPMHGRFCLSRETPLKTTWYAPIYVAAGVLKNTNPDPSHRIRPRC
jgi:hypothetical protein